jgi:F-type H+-transporting ATPase subunit b
MSDLLHNFGIDWKLLLAQAVNFFILLYILKRYAYAPVVKMLDERQRKIKKGLHDSAEAEKRLKDASEKGRDIVKAAEAKALDEIGRAEETAREREAELIEAAHRKADSVLQSARKAAEGERERASEEMEGAAKDLVLLATAKVLGKMEPSERDAHLVGEALKELRVAAKHL